MGPLREHDEGPGRMHEHGRLSVPVGLGPDGDPGGHDIDHPPTLGKFYDTSNDGGRPIEVLRPAVYRDLGPAGEGHPIDGESPRLGII